MLLRKTTNVVPTELSNIIPRDLFVSPTNGEESSFQRFPAAVSDVSKRVFWSQLISDVRHFRDQKTKLCVNNVKCIFYLPLYTKTVSFDNEDDMKWRKKTVFPQRGVELQFHLNYFHQFMRQSQQIG